MGLTGYGEVYNVLGSLGCPYGRGGVFIFKPVGERVTP